MLDPNPQRIIGGVCPNCGQSRINVVGEGILCPFPAPPQGATSIIWMGKCCQCDQYIEALFKTDINTENLIWMLMSEEKVEFVFGS